MKNKILLNIAFVFFLLIATAFAQEEDFGITGSEVIDALRCTSAESSFAITNTGDFISTYFLSIDGSAAEWATVVPGSFTLKPGEEKAVKASLDVPCDIPLRKHSLIVYIETAGGLFDTFEIDVFVDNPENAEVEAKELFKSIYPCTEAVFNFKVKNPYGFQEKYTMGINRFKDESTLSEKRFVLEPLKSKDVSLAIKPKDCSMSGTFPITLLIETEKTGFEVETDFELEITPNGILNIAQGVDKIKAGFAESSAEITLTNKGDESTAYTLALEGPEWVSLEKTALIIGAGKSEKLKILTKPSEEISSGEHAITIKAIVDKTKAEYSKKIAIKLTKPNFLDKLIARYPSYFTAGIVLLIIIAIIASMVIRTVTSEEHKKKRSERKKEKEKLKEQRKKEQERLKKEKEKEELQKEKEIERIKKLKEAELKKEFAFVPKKGEGKKLSGKGALRVFLWSIVLAVIVFGYHLRALIKANIAFLIAGIAVLIMLYLLDRLLSGFSRTARFKEVIANRKNEFSIGWRKGLGQGAVSLREALNKLKLRFRKGRQKRAYSSAGELVYQYFIGFANVEDEKIKEVELRFKVKKSWLKRNNIYPSDVKLLAYVDGKWAGVPTVPAGEDKIYKYYKATADHLGQFAIAGKSGKPKPARRTGFFIGLILIIIAIIIAAYLPTAFKKPAVVKGISPQFWSQGDTHSIDLSQFFRDPDGRPLRFEAAEVENIDVWISSDGIATFTPDFGFYGEREVVFTAYDEQGLKVSSNNVKLVVTKSVLPLTVRRHLGFILGGVIVIIFILLLIIYREPLKKFVMEE